MKCFLRSLVDFVIAVAVVVVVAVVVAVAELGERRTL